MKNILIVIFAISNLIACGQNNSVSSTTIQPFKMKSTGNKEIDNLVSKLKTSMEDYMKDANPLYSQSDIEECIDLLTNHVISVFKTHSKDDALRTVESTVLKLNALNDKCDGTLIETNEREQIAEIIILAGNKMGYNDVDEDITEEWREW